MQNPVYLVNEILESISNSRTREVIARRFGLDKGRRHTLEAIGQDYGITRERVRQIEDSGLNVLRRQEVLEKLRPLFSVVKDHLDEHGGLKKEDSLYNDLSYICLPVKEIERMKKANDFSDLERCQSAFYLVLTLDDDFERVPESDHFHPVWTMNKKLVRQAKKTIDSVVKCLEDKKQVLAEEELMAMIKSLAPELSEKAIFSYIDASKHIKKSHLGHFGLIHWPEISPRGVKDKAFIVLKHAAKPLHFTEVTEMINRVLFSDRQAYAQTVHNELIKDPRFVLVGRGLYALTDWGYQSGTVADIIRDVLNSEGPLTKEAVIDKVLAKRLVKKNTILINLQNRKIFNRDEAGKYLLVG